MHAFGGPGFVGPAFLPSAFVAGGLATRPVLSAGGRPRPAVVLLTMTSRAAEATLTAPQTLVTAEGLGANVTVARSQTPSGATVGEVDATGTYAEIPAATPRWSYPTRMLKVFGGRTNLLANPRTPGGTGWTSTGIASTAAVTGPDGAAGTATRLTENTSASAHRIDHASISFTAGETYTLAALLRAGTRDAAQLLFSATSFDTNSYGNFDLANGAIGSTGSALTRHAISGPYAGYYLCEISAPATATASSGPVLFMATGPSASRAPSYTGASGTLDVGWAWCVEAADAGSPSLPAAGAPAATYRGADVPTWTPAAMPRRGCIVVRGVVEALPSAFVAGLLQIDDGSDSNRLMARITTSGGQPECLIVSGGVVTATLTPAGGFVAGTPFSALLAWSPGGVRFGTNVGGVVSASLACPSGLVRAILGHSRVDLIAPLNGALHADLYEWWPSEAEAAAMLAA